MKAAVSHCYSAAEQVVSAHVDSALLSSWGKTCTIQVVETHLYTLGQEIRGDWSIMWLLMDFDDDNQLYGKLSTLQLKCCNSLFIGMTNVILD